MASKVLGVVGGKKKTDSKFFQTTKRGEIQELKEELHARDKDKQKDAVKKVIASMTVGKDVSALFADVVNLISTDSLELKKLVYLYVMNYAKAQPELAILSINAFFKDASDSNPLIRSLAVRTMGCIRISSVIEYLLDPLRKCCNDPDPYVRKTAAICIPKVYELDPEQVKDKHLLENLKEMLGDPNPMVVSNAVAGMAEISETCGQDLLDLNARGSRESTVGKLLTALNECNEWGQVFILDALAKYTPTDSQDAESITERITARLSHANPAVVLAGIKVVIRCMEYIDGGEIHRMLCKKLNAPLVTLLSCEPEVQYVALRGIRLVVQKIPGVLSADVKMFFCRYNDPSYVKLEKLDILVMLVAERNMEQVLLELKEYASGVDVDFVRKAVRSIGRVAVRLERACERAISVLLELIETRVNYVVQEATVVIKDIFRKYPSRYEQVLSALCESLDVLDEPEAKASMIWILGEYAERIENIEQIMEDFLDTFHDEQPMVQMQLLTAIVKLFLKKPHQAQQDMISRVLKCATEESNNHDLRDRGYIYWRLLSTDPEGTKQIVLGDKPTIKDESSQLDKSLLDRLLMDLSLLSSVYHQESREFVTRVQTAEREPGEDGEEQEEEYSKEDRAARRREIQREVEEGPTAPTTTGGGLDLLDLMGDGDMGGSSSAAAPAPVAASGGGGLDDLLGGLGGPAPAAAPAPVQIQKLAALQPTAAGQGGKTGFGVMAAMVRQGGRVNLLMTFSNSTPGPLNGFAIQVNKNSYGLAPQAAIPPMECAPGGTCEVVLPMNVGQNLSGQAPSNPMFLQVAVKNNIDIFYFYVHFDLSAVLKEQTAVDRDTFTRIWQGVGEGRQAMSGGTPASPLNPENVKTILATDNVHYIAQRSADGATFVYVAATTEANQNVLAEVQLGGPTVRVAVRSEVPQLMPCFGANLMKKLRIQA